MKPSSKFDIVVYGATGFTGQLVAEYLASHYAGKPDLKWAMAGRSLDKLASVRDAIGAPADTALIVADAGDPVSLKAMVDQTGSVLTTVGPYQLYGSELVAACVASGTWCVQLVRNPGRAEVSDDGGAIDPSHLLQPRQTSQKWFPRPILWILVGRAAPSLRGK